MKKETHVRYCLGIGGRLKLLELLQKVLRMVDMVRA